MWDKYPQCPGDVSSMNKLYKVQYLQTGDIQLQSNFVLVQIPTT